LTTDGAVYQPASTGVADVAEMSLLQCIDLGFGSSAGGPRRVERDTVELLDEGSTSDFLSGLLPCAVDPLCLMFDHELRGVRLAVQAPELAHLANQGIHQELLRGEPDPIDGVGSRTASSARWRKSRTAAASCAPRRLLRRSEEVTAEAGRCPAREDSAGGAREVAAVSESTAT
jgi:hypothetical protein